MKDTRTPAQKLRMLKFKTSSKEGLVQKLTVKDFLNTSGNSGDNSTVSFVQSLGGQLNQYYSLHIVEQKADDLSKSYYLLSDLYPISTKEDYTVTSKPTFSMTMESRVTHIEPVFDQFASTSFNLAAMDSKVVILRPVLPLDTETINSNLGTLVAMDSKDVIFRQYNNDPIDKMASTGSKLISLDSKDYPYLDFSLSEMITSKINKIEFKIVPR